jgi:hypothetical protein
MRALTLVITALLLAACAGSSPGSAAPPTSAPPASATPSSSPPTGQALAALVDFPNGTGPQSTGYDLALVGADGHVAARAHAAARGFIGTGGSGGGAAALDLPEVSAANGRVYYLDGDQNLRSLTPSGSSGVIATVPGSQTAHVGFAVSPDGHGIAVSVLTYSGSTASVSSLYVQDLTGGNRRDITHTGTDLVWPVGWHGNNLVLAVAPNGFSQQGLILNPYFAASFQLVDPATSNRVATIGGPDFTSGCQVTGLVVPTGTACYHRTSGQITSELWLLNWTGARIDTLAVQQSSPAAALHPAQQSVAICCDDTRAVLVAQGHATPAATALKGSPDSWPCWVDDQHLLAGSVNDHQFQPGVLTVGGGSVAQVDAHGFCAAVLGGAGAAGEPM